jgi:hypothetical protein
LIGSEFVARQISKEQSSCEAVRLAGKFLYSEQLRYGFTVSPAKRTQTSSSIPSPLAESDFPVVPLYFNDAPEERNYRQRGPTFWAIAFRKGFIWDLEKERQGLKPDLSCARLAARLNRLRKKFRIRA